MVTTKEEFIRTFLPDKIQDVHFVQIDLDITDLSLADVLRNVNMTYPKNSRTRNALASGQYAVGILCKTELLDPLSGIFIIITGDDTEINIVSKNYIVIGISEDKITNDDEINEVLNNIIGYLIKTIREGIPRFTEFFAKYVYDQYEMEEMEDDD